MSSDDMAVVTGASSGIGEALARGLAARGYRLTLVARRKERLDALANNLRAVHGVEVEVRPCDLADRDQRRLLRDELAEQPVSLFCNNAGFPTCGAIADSDPDVESDEVEVNAVAMHELTRAVLPGMLRRRCGTVLITGSTAGELPVPTAATYSATKAFTNTFAQALRQELRGTGVTCTLLSPGPVYTEFTTVGGIPGAERTKWFSWTDPQRVSETAIRGALRGKGVVIPGLVAKAQSAAGHHTPRSLLFPVLRGLILPSLRNTGKRPQ